jgi:flagellar biosynthesis protein FliQ
MEKEKYIEDLREIRKMMDQSSQFLSLSGLSGVLAGIYALIGAGIVHRLILNHKDHLITLESQTFKKILFVAAAVLITAIITAIILTLLKAKKNNEKLWNKLSQRLIINFVIPFFTGGIFSILLLKHGVYGLIGPVTLIFYGLACVNASKYTLRDVRYLGITMVVLGLLATAFLGNTLYFWAAGFGGCHIIYGIIMYVKYDRGGAQ